MSKRFANLEFDDERRSRKQSLDTQRTEQRSERDYLAQAHEEYHWGRFEQALRLYTRCLEESRSVVPAWVGQVQMLVQLGEYNEARLWSDKALELFRDNGELLAAKAQACLRLKDHRAAMACSDASLQCPGSSPWRWQVRGEALLAKGQNFFDQCFRKALNEPGADWFDHVVIARIYRFYQRTSNALQYLKAAVQLEPTHGYIWFEMGQCQAAVGLTSAARSSFARCLELRPNYREAQAAIDAVGSMSFVEWIKRILFLRIGP